MKKIIHFFNFFINSLIVIFGHFNFELYGMLFVLILTFDGTLYFSLKTSFSEVFF